MEKTGKTKILLVEDDRDIQKINTIAIASVHGLDCVLSYNFQHINKLKTKILTERVNRAEGYKGIVICTSREVLDDE